MNKTKAQTRWAVWWWSWDRWVVIHSCMTREIARMEKADYERVWGGTCRITGPHRLPAKETKP